MVIGLSTLTPTYLFVLVRGGYRRPFGYGLLMTPQSDLTACPDTKQNWLTAVSKRPSYQHPNRDHHEGESDD